MAKKDFKKSIAEQFMSAAEEQPETKPQETKAEEEIIVPKGWKLTKDANGNLQMQRDPKSQRLQLLIRPTTKEAIKKLADAQGISTNDLVNQILEEYIERQGNA